ncbi:hypothetical protein GGS24DRAFT_505840 [Hypoxylon argillaceum]|nr:hypothetical protein GGS24DRAFT_505840 [Hypoxylon argillaceum]
MFPIPSTTDQAKLVRSQTSRFPLDFGEKKVAKQASKLKARIIRIMELVQDEKLESDGLRCEIERTSDAISKLDTYSSSIQSWSEFLYQLGKDSKLNATRRDIRFRERLIDLRKEANFTSERYSNADLTTILEQLAVNWKEVGRITTRCTNYTAKIQWASREIEFDISLNANFRAACTNLAERISGYPGLGIDETALLVTCNPGEIRLETSSEALTPMVLWVHYNVFIVAKLQLEIPKILHNKKLLTPSEAESMKEFNSSTERLFQSIREGCVTTVEEVSRPKVGRHHIRDPRALHTFTVCIDVDRECFCGVEWEGRIIAYKRYSAKRINSSYRFTFVAFKPGEVSVTFNFADARTYNISSTRINIRIEEDDKTEHADHIPWPRPHWLLDGQGRRPFR